MADKERSPNYPAISLPAAADCARSLYSNDGRSALPMEALAKALGHESLSGPARTKIGSLNQFGLLERVADGRYKLSRTGLELALHNATDPEYRAALRQAAAAPKLFEELFRDYPEASENTVKVHLIKDRGFSEDGAKKAAKAYVSTRLEAGTADANDDLAEESVDEKAGGELGSTDVGVRTAPARVSEQSESRPIPTNLRRGDVFNWLLTDGVTAQVAFSGTATPAAIDMLIEYLSLMKRALPSQKVSAISEASVE